MYEFSFDPRLSGPSHALFPDADGKTPGTMVVEKHSKADVRLSSQRSCRVHTRETSIGASTVAADDAAGSADAVTNVCGERRTSQKMLLSYSAPPVFVS